jgi:hypothetical protein
LPRAVIFRGVDQNNSRRLRLLFKTGEVHRQFCKFEQRGDDLYWFPSREPSPRSTGAA